MAVIAYGATNTGKSYTIVGTPENRGLLYPILKLVMDARFDKVELSLIEIYNDVLKDLTTFDKSKCDIKSIDQGIFSGLQEHEITSTSQALELVEKALQKRQLGSTALNSASSRSHLIVRVRAIRRTCEPTEIQIIDLGTNQSYLTFSWI